MSDMAAQLEQWLNPYNLQLIMLAVINGLLALSVWTPLSAGQLSLGSAGFMSIGAYTAALLSLNRGWPMIATIPAAALVAGVVAVIVGYPALRLRGVYLAIATLAFGEMVRIVALNLRVTRGALGLPGIPQMVDETAWYLMDNYADDGYVLGLDPYTVAGLSILAVLLLLLFGAVYFLTAQAHSRTGRALTAIRLDDAAAQSMGIDLTKYKLLVFGQSGLLAGLAGGLYAHLYYFISPGDFGFNRAIEMLLYVVLGGMETVWGALVGAGALSLLPEMLRFSASYRNMTYGALLIIMMTFRPQGLITRRRGTDWRQRLRVESRDGLPVRRASNGGRPV